MSQAVTFHSKGIPIAANLFVPSSKSASAKRPAIVVSHPFGGVKEQTAGSMLSFSASRAASSHLPSTLPTRAHLVASRATSRTPIKNIGALGICASGGYVPFAAQTDHRIKAVATVSAVDMERLFRDGMWDSTKREDLKKALEKAGKERNLEAAGNKPHLEHLVPNTLEEVADGTPALYKEGTEYYRTPRAQHPNSVNWFIERSIDMLATYSSYAFIDLISPRPLLMIAGDIADTLYFSKEAVEKAEGPKELFLVKGKSHIDLYDDTTEVLPKLVEFMKQHLAA